MKNDTLENIFAIPDEALQVLNDEEERGGISLSLHNAPARGLIYRSNQIMRLDAELRSLEAKYKPLIEEMESQLKFIQNRIEFQKNCIKQVLVPGPDAEYIDDNISLFYTTTTACEITDEEQIPIEYSRVTTKPAVSEIKKVLESGTNVPGARLVLNYNLQVKPGGPKAKKNAETRRNRRIEKIVEE